MLHLIGPGVAWSLEDVPPQAVLAKAYTDQARPLFEAYCIRCHGPKQDSGGLRLDNLDPKMPAETVPEWTEVMNKLNVGTMPPAKETRRPTRQEQEQLLSWVGGSLKRYEIDHRETGGNTPLRRINHRAYANIMHTLLGVPVLSMQGLPADAATNGFDTVGAGLSTISYLYDLYLASAKQALDLAIVTDPSPPKVTEVRYPDRIEAQAAMKVLIESLENYATALQGHPIALATAGSDELDQPRAVAL